MISIIGALIAALAVIVAAGFTLWGQRRITKGEVSTSTADRLWAEMEAMKNEYKAQTVELRTEVASLTVICAGLRERVVETERQILAGTIKMEDAERQIAKDKIQIDECMRAANDCEAREVLLQQRITELERDLSK